MMCALFHVTELDPMVTHIKDEVHITFAPKGEWCQGILELLPIYNSPLGQSLPADAPSLVNKTQYTTW